MTVHAGKISFFILLSVCDLFLTHRLVQGSAGLVSEGNPIAHAWLACFGWLGLACFKSMIVVLVGACSKRLWQPPFAVATSFPDWNPFFRIRDYFAKFSEFLLIRRTAWV
jgi:hypothetical protein